MADKKNLMEIGTELAATLVVAVQEFSEIDEAGEKKHADLKKIFKKFVRDAFEGAEDVATAPLPDPIEMIADMVLDSPMIEGFEETAADAVSSVAAETTYQIFKLMQGILGSEVVKQFVEKAKQIKAELEV